MIDKSKVKLIRLISGEEILSEVVNATPSGPTQSLILEGAVRQFVPPTPTVSTLGGDLHLSNPHVIITRQTPQGGVSLAIAPWVVYKKNKEEVIVIRSNVVVFVCDPHPNLVDELEKVTSDLILPDRKIVTP
jgi:hypothetical protein